MTEINDYDFKLEFCNPQTKQDPVYIPFKLFDRELSRKWLKELYYTHIVLNQIPRNNRFSSFQTDKWTPQKFALEINKHIDTINNEHPGLIDQKIDEVMTQDDHNRLHVYFEKYRGPVLDPHPFFANGSYAYRNAMEQLNVLIHMWEHHNYLDVHRRAVFDFDHARRLPLLQDDYEWFTPVRDFGKIYLSYAEVGKHLYEIYQDDDEHVGDSNIRPQRYFSAAFVLNLHQFNETKESIFKKYYQWFDRNSNWLNSLGFYKNDPMNAIGYAEVAYISTDLTNQQVIDLIEPRQFLSGIKFFIDGE